MNFRETVERVLAHVKEGAHAAREARAVLSQAGVVETCHDSVMYNCPPLANSKPPPSWYEVFDA